MCGCHHPYCQCQTSQDVEHNKARSRQLDSAFRPIQARPVWWRPITTTCRRRRIQTLSSTISRFSGTCRFHRWAGRWQDCRHGNFCCTANSGLGALLLYGSMCSALLLESVETAVDLKDAAPTGVHILNCSMPNSASISHKPQEKWVSDPRFRRHVGKDVGNPKLIGPSCFRFPIFKTPALKQRKECTIAESVETTAHPGRP